MRRLVLGIAVAVTSLVPTIGSADDQQIADYIKSRLQVEQQQGNLRGFNVDMRVDRGTVWFKGHVSNPEQEMTILKAAQQAGHLGVVQVVDDIEVNSIGQSAQSVVERPRTRSIQQRSEPKFQNAAYQQAPQADPQTIYQQTSNQEYIEGASQGIVSNGPPMSFANASMPTGQACASGNCGGGYVDGGYGGPAPMAASYSSAGQPSESPNLPGYAWPGYAAHPNYGAVSYPKQYSPSAWPYIGPFYPYPQVPLGWRKVTLEWDDGWWMLDFHDK